MFIIKCLVWFLKVYRYVGLFKKLDICFISPEGYGDYIEHAFQTCVRKSLTRPQVGLCGLGYASLLHDVHIVLWRGLNAVPAGLDFYKMYSSRIGGNYVYFKMSVPPVPFQNQMSPGFQHAAGKIFPLLS